MTTLVVTVAWQGRRRDLAVPADVPVADLLWPLALAMVIHRPTPVPPGDGGATPAFLPAGDGGAALASAFVPPGDGGAAPAPALPLWRELALAPLGGAPLPADRTLAACGIGDGAVLVLIDGSSFRPRAGPAP
jgi:WXG100 protein secretion system (Wss), protein YukD